MNSINLYKNIIATTNVINYIYKVLIKFLLSGCCHRKLIQKCFSQLGPEWPDVNNKCNSMFFHFYIFLRMYFVAKLCELWEILWLLLLTWKWIIQNFPLWQKQINAIYNTTCSFNYTHFREKFQTTLRVLHTKVNDIPCKDLLISLYILNACYTEKAWIQFWVNS